MTDFRHTLESALSGTYTIEQELSGGGMSRVFVALDRTLDRKVVVKVLSPDIAADVNTERFRREIHLAAKLQHPHIVTLITSGEMGGLPFFTMPYLEGESLRTRLSRDGELPAGEAVRYLRQIASALAHAHRHGIVHRDIKPDNIMLVEDFAQVLDFGVAKALTSSTQSGTAGLTTRGVAIGTPAYMSPEQAVGDPSVDHRADIYAFGVVAYEALTGSHPFAGRPPQAQMAAHALETPESLARRRPGLPEELVAIVARCMEKRPSDRFQSASELAAALEAAGTMIATPTRSHPVTASARNGRYAAMAGAVVIIAIAAFAGSRTLSSRRAVSEPPMLELKSVAVLPLTNVGTDAKDEYFSDGMTDELANALSKLSGLRVASRTSAYSFKGQKNVGAAEIAKRLNVQTLLEGTVRRSGDRLRVFAQLTNAADGLTLWSESYERESKDVFAVQDDIAKSVAEALKLKIAGGGSPGSSARGTASLEAYDFYMRGRYFWNLRGDRNIRTAITYLDNSIRADAEFGRAHAARAIAYVLLREYTDSLRPAERAEGEKSARRALAIDPRLAEAHTALGLNAVHNNDYDAAAGYYRRAIALDPYYATAYQWLGEQFYATGRVDSSLAYMKKAAELDPLAPIIPSALGYTQMLAGDLDGAVATVKRGIELAPQLGMHHSTLAKIYLVKGDLALASRSAEMAERLEPLSLRKALYCYIAAANGRTAEARKILNELLRAQEQGHKSRTQVAIAYTGLGEKDNAFRELELAAREKNPSVNGTMLVEPLWKPLRSDPRFMRLMEQVGAAKYAANLKRPL